MSRSRKAPRSRRQQRKAEARAGGPLFTPEIGETHRYGNRATRRRAWASARGKGSGMAWRIKKRKRGERYGRNLENLIRSGAPLSLVNAERTMMRDLLK